MKSPIYHRSALNNEQNQYRRVCRKIYNVGTLQKRHDSPISYCRIWLRSLYFFDLLPLLLLDILELVNVKATYRIKIKLTLGTIWGGRGWNLIVSYFLYTKISSENSKLSHKIAPIMFFIFYFICLILLDRVQGYPTIE